MYVKYLNVGLHSVWYSKLMICHLLLKLWACCYFIMIYFRFSRPKVGLGISKMRLAMWIYYKCLEKVYWKATLLHRQFFVSQVKVMSTIVNDSGRNLIGFWLDVCGVKIDLRPTDPHFAKNIYKRTKVVLSNCLSCYFDCWVKL